MGWWGAFILIPKGAADKVILDFVSWNCSSSRCFRVLGWLGSDIVWWCLNLQLTLTSSVCCLRMEAGPYWNDTCMWSGLLHCMELVSMNSTWNPVHLTSSSWSHNVTLPCLVEAVIQTCPGARGSDRDPASGWRSGYISCYMLSYDAMSRFLFLFLILFLCTCVWLLLCICTAGVWVPSESRRGHQIPWDLSYRQLWAT